MEKVMEKTRLDANERLMCADSFFVAAIGTNGVRSYTVGVNEVKSRNDMLDYLIGIQIAVADLLVNTASGNCPESKDGVIVDVVAQCSGDCSMCIDMACGDDGSDNDYEDDDYPSFLRT